MASPLVVSVPHELGKEEAVRRLKDGLGRRKGPLLIVQEQTWDGDHLAFRASVLDHPVSGTIDVREDHAVLEVELPPPLAKFAATAERMICREGSVMLEKK